MRSRQYLLMMVSVVAVAVVLMTGCPPSQEVTTPPPPERPDISGTMPGSTPTAASEYTVGMRGNVFAPQQLAAPAGAQITFVNDCTEDHTVTPDVAGIGPNSDDQYPAGMKPGDIYMWTVPETSTTGEAFYYYCRFHGGAGDGTTMGSGMAGEIEVGAENTE